MWEPRAHGEQLWYWTSAGGIICTWKVQSLVCSLLSRQETLHFTLHMVALPNSRPHLCIEELAEHTQVTICLISQEVLCLPLVVVKFNGQLNTTQNHLES